MQKIDKSTILSNNYKEWLDTLGDNHPSYNSSSNKYYNDIKMSLLHCQKGLCAYTEELLCDERFIKIENWDENKYKKELTKLEIDEVQGDLEHFDESLKPTQGWLWDNFFVVNTYVNCRIKLSKSIIKGILKPDDENYDPYKYLSFSYETGIFSPNVSLTKEEQENVKYMIEILGLNCIHIKRKKQLKEWMDRYELGLPIDNYQFITAWEMTLNNLNNE